MGSRFRHFLIGLLALAMFAPAPGGAQPADGRAYSQEELDQLLAPVALYPDELLMQVLIASTYPLEVIDAARFVQRNPNLRGESLDEAVAGRNWDPSVQSLAAFPQVLEMMNEKLDWMQRLGDAFLVDQQRVMDTVQALRARAQAQGNLQSTPQQSVLTQDRVIIIEPVQPEYVYVPYYNPQVVYGPWWAPAYEPWFWNPSRDLRLSGLGGNLDRHLLRDRMGHLVPSLGLGAPGLAPAPGQRPSDGQPFLEPPGLLAAAARRDLAARAQAPPGRRVPRSGDVRPLPAGESRRGALAPGLPRPRPGRAPPQRHAADSRHATARRQRRSAGVRRHAAGTGRDATAVARDTAGTGRDATAVSRDTAGTGHDATAVSRDTAGTGHGAATVPRDAAGAGRGVFASPGRAIASASRRSRVRPRGLAPASGDERPARPAEPAVEPRARDAERPPAPQCRHSSYHAPSAPSAKPPASAPPAPSSRSSSGSPAPRGGVQKH